MKSEDSFFRIFSYNLSLNEWGQSHNKVRMVKIWLKVSGFTENILIVHLIYCKPRKQRAIKFCAQKQYVLSPSVNHDTLKRISFSSIWAKVPRTLFLELHSFGWQNPPQCLPVAWNI